MAITASIWLGLSILLCLFAWAANRRFLLFFLPFGAVIAAASLWPITGMPRFTSPPAGRYAVLGVKIVPEVGIWVLLDDGIGEPVYYRLPWSAKSGNDLQDALNEGKGKGVVAKFTGQPGGESYDGPPPVTGEEHKTPETPEFSF